MNDHPIFNGNQQTNIENCCETIKPINLCWVRDFISLVVFRFGCKCACAVPVSKGKKKKFLVMFIRMVKENKINWINSRLAFDSVNWKLTPTLEIWTYKTIESLNRKKFVRFFFHLWSSICMSNVDFSTLIT